MRVVHVHRIRGIGGSERHLLTLLPALAARGVEPVFLGLDDPRATPEPFYRELGVESVRLPCRARPRSGARVARSRRELRRLRPDVVHTHLVHARRLRGARRRGGAARLDEAQRRPLPARAVPLRGAGADAAGGARDRDHRGAAALLRRAGRAAGGEGRGRPLRARRAAGALGRRAPDVALPDGARVLLCVCRLAEQKGVDVAVRALAAIRERSREAVLVVLGEGPERRARWSARRGRLPAGPRRRRGRVVPARRAARAPGALGGLRPRAARGDAGRQAGRRRAGQLGAGDRRRRRDGPARPAGRPALRWPMPCSACWPTRARAGGDGRRRDSRGRGASSRSRDGGADGRGLRRVVSAER